MHPHMNSPQRPLWHYTMIPRIKWEELRPNISDEIKGIVDHYFETAKDPVKCWEEVEIRLHAKWTDDPYLYALLEILMDCTATSRFLHNS